MTEKKYEIDVWIDQEMDHYQCNGPLSHVKLTREAFEELCDHGKAKHMEHGKDFLYADETWSKIVPDEEDKQ